MKKIINFTHFSLQKFLFFLFFFLKLHAGYQSQSTYFLSGTSLGVLGLVSLGWAYENGGGAKYVLPGLFATSGAALLWKSGILEPSATPQQHTRIKSYKYPLFAATVNALLYDQKGPLLDFMRYAGGTGAMLYATYRFGEIIHGREGFKCTLLPGLLFLGGTSILKKSDFLGWRLLKRNLLRWRLLKRNLLTRDKYESDEPAITGAILTISGATTLIFKAMKNPIDAESLILNAFPLIKLFVNEDTFKSIAPKMALVFGITAPVLGLGVARRYYEPKKIEDVLRDLKRPTKELVRVDADLDEITLNQKRKIVAMHLFYGTSKEGEKPLTCKNSDGNLVALPLLPIELVQYIFSFSFAEEKKLIPTIEKFIYSVDYPLKNSRFNFSADKKIEKLTSAEIIDIAKKICREPISKETKNALFEFVKNEHAEQTCFGKRFLRWVFGPQHAKIAALNKIFSEKNKNKTTQDFTLSPAELVRLCDLLEVPEHTNQKSNS